MLKEQQERINNMIDLLNEEKANPNGSSMYISDLEDSIKQLEHSMKNTEGNFMIMNVHDL